MNWWESILLGLIQGLTEFLPVSSSGHLVLGKHVLGLSTGEDVLFEVMVHFGTIMSVFWVYRTRIIRLTIGCLKAAPRIQDYGRSWKENAEFRMGGQVVITMLPVMLAYFLWGEQIVATFSEPQFAAGMLFVTGTLLLLVRLRPSTSGDITPGKSLVIGIAQAAAMFPGISRSGATICAGIYQGVDREKAADFSFLILLPVVLGATVLKVGDAVSGVAQADWGILILATVVAFVSGIWAIRLVLGAVRKGHLGWFAVYCFVAGGIGLYLL